MFNRSLRRLADKLLVATPSQGALPITPGEFFDAFAAAWRNGPVSRQQLRGRKFGLAISGGVDSMALARLCQNLATKTRPDLNLSFKAFIVDHGARSGSAAEAAKVAELLQSFRLSSKVIPAEWTANKFSSNKKTSAFETHARIARYRALGKACREEGITSLFLAHHADDEAETVLSRLIQRHGGSGMQGLRSAADIPECFGIYGVHQSGEPLRVLRPSNSSDIERQGKQDVDNGDGDRLEMESGGIQIYRPLLRFRKQRLIATCVESGTTWVEDETNHDVTLTPRNAIRKLLQENRLPRALRVPSILALASRLREMQQERGKKVAELMNECQLDLDTRVGCLKMRLPRRTVSSNGDLESPARLDPAVARLFIKFIVEAVSPSRGYVSDGDVEAVSEALFPSPSEESTKPIQKNPPPGIIVKQVLFRRISAPSSPPDQSDADQAATLDGNHTWLVMRQPTKDNTNSKAPPSQIKFPSILKEYSHDRNHWTEWSLWDNRFWIRLQNNSQETITLRFFSPDDLQYLSSQKKWKKGGMYIHTHVHPEHDRLRKVMKELGTLDVRFSLPVLVNQSRSFLVFPTLRSPLGGMWRGVEWEVRYRHV
ncbi:MAG: hypothetical protein M1823_005133 [Watsoniomyces obsoletus]|nr:MAG: hypothetical protein M1823_005133 [Watsoniomyces obsoletus]